jgi:hypothetical protein
MIDVAKDRADMGVGFSKSNFLRFASTVAQKDGKGFKNGKKLTLVRSTELLPCELTCLLLLQPPHMTLLLQTISSF